VPVQSCRGDLSLDRSPNETRAPIENDQDPVNRLNAHFQLVSANTQELIESAFALRYQVYCIERQFEDPSRQVDGLETDDFDRHAVHSLIFYRPRAEVIGTARLILPQARPNSLPIQQLLKKNGLNALDHFPNESAAEISRFAISKEYRRRSVESGSLSDTGAKRERQGNLPCLGLIQILLRQSVELGIEYWGAVMEPQLLRMLAQMGIRFQPIGPLVSYHGLRQPSFCHIPLMLRNLALTRPEAWAVVTNNGELMCSPVQAKLMWVA
jgi:N-acyl amino acid synthase of PEP-CTERM/exosortase system